MSRFQPHRGQSQATGIEGSLHYASSNQRLSIRRLLQTLPEDQAKHEARVACQLQGLPTMDIRESTILRGYQYEASECEQSTLTKG